MFVHLIVLTVFNINVHEPMLLSTTSFLSVPSAHVSHVWTMVSLPVIDRLPGLKEDKLLQSVIH